MMTPGISTFGATVVAVRLASFGRSFGATIMYFGAMLPAGCISMHLAGLYRAEMGV